MDKVKRLLERGYFPSQLPPAFSTRSFANSYKTLEANWTVHPIARMNTRGEFFSVARVGHARRPITIPNPAPQLFLSRAIAQYWRPLRQLFKRSKISLSRPEFKADGTRAVEITSLSELAEQRLILSAGSRYVLKTDVSRFFPTIYTHSIPWALHGKAASKANPKNKTPAFFGNLIDQAVGLTQERQTIGVPIGPDTSHIIGEIVASAVDVLVRKDLKRWPVGYRHVDDYFLCFDSESDSQRALTAITKALREFELDINVTKTKIISVEDLREDDWTEDIKGMALSQTATTQRQDIQRLFGRAFDLARRDENVIKYTLKKSEGVRIEEENWELYEAYVLRCGLISPNCLSSVAEILATYKALGYKLSSNRIRAFCRNVIIPAARSEHHSEVIWGLWIALELGVRLERSVTASLGGMRSAVSALTALYMRDCGLLDGQLNTALWQTALTPVGLRSPMWMLAYEATRKGWLTPSSPNFVSSDAVFGPMEAASVTFFETTNRLEPFIRKVVAKVADSSDPLGQLEVEEYQIESSAEQYAS